MTKNPWNPHDQDDQDRAEGKDSGRHQAHEFDHKAYNSDHYSDSTSGRLGRLLAFLIGIGLLLGSLALAFPEQSMGDPYLVRGVLILAIFGGAAVYWSRSNLFRILKAVGLWAAIIFGISVFYIYQSEFGARFMAAVDPAGAANADGDLVIHRSTDGHFRTRVRINGVPVRMIVDTGASNIVLNQNDAERVGLKPDFLLYDRTARTAGGTTRIASARAEILNIGGFVFEDVPVSVNQSEMDTSLMGMTLLRQFSSIEIQKDIMILRN